MSGFKYDIAISLCKQDVDFAHKLVAAINPALKVFFYATEVQQQKLINESGPEAFANTFKTEARIVVILSRNEWGESIYTEIERNAIIDRTAVKNIGYGFLMLIPMVTGEIPAWYPSTRIYANPRNFSIEQLAKFIEFKVTDEGGVVKKLTAEDYAKSLKTSLAEKRRLVQLQINTDAINAAHEESKKFRILFAKKCTDINNINTGLSIGQSPPSEHDNNGCFQLENYKLTLNISPLFTNHRIGSTQFYFIEFRLIESLGYNYSNEFALLKNVKYNFFYTETLSGWCIPIEHKNPQHQNNSLLFYDGYKTHYDLKNPVSTEQLIDDWFVELIKLIEKSYKKHL